MSYTSGVAIALTLVIETVLGFFYGGGEENVAAVEEILVTLDRDFAIGPWHLIPPILVIVCAYKKAPAIPGLVAGGRCGGDPRTDLRRHHLPGASRCRL